MKRYRRVLTGLLSLIIVLLIVVLFLLPEPPAPASGAFAAYANAVEDADAAQSARRPDDAEAADSGDMGSVPSEVQDYRLQSGEEASVSRTRPVEPAVIGAVGRIAIVIDDAGNRPADVDGFAELGLPLTIAVLPQLPGTADAARRALDAGMEVILHLPLEAASGQWPGPGTIFTSYSDTEIQSLVRANLESVPGAVGVNSHMGSLATADSRVMAAVSAEIARHGLYFLDSRTTAETVAAMEARRTGIPTLERSAFLDNSPDPGLIRDALLQAVSASPGRDLILIGHAGTHTLPDVLARELPDLQARGWEIVPLSALVSDS